MLTQFCLSVNQPECTEKKRTRRDALSVFTILHLFFRSFAFALCDAVIQPDGEVGAQGLENLYEDNEQNDGDIEDERHSALVTVVDGQAAQTAATNGRGHGAIAQNGDESRGEAID